MSTQLTSAIKQTPPSVPAAARPSLWPVPMFLIGVLAFLGVAATVTTRPPRTIREWDHDFDQVQAALAQPGDPPLELRLLAESLAARVEVRPEKAGQAHLLLGCVYMRSIEHAPPAAQLDFRVLALERFRQAEALGLPAADLARAHYRTGVICLQMGNLSGAIENLSHSIGHGADDPAAGYALLATAYLSLKPPDYDAALKANQRQLEVISSDEAAAPVRLRRAEILFNKGLRLDAIKVLERIGPGTAPAVRYAARFLQARCATEEELWNQAVLLWREVLLNPEETPAGRARVLFVLGQCARKLNPPDDAGAAAAWQEAVQAGGDEGQAASLALAEMRLAGTNPAAALDDFRHALGNVKSDKDYHNSLFALAHVCELLEQGCQACQDNRDFEHARQLAELYRKLAAPAQAQERFADISEAWAQDLEDQAQHEGKADLREQARKRYAEAGEAYLQAGRPRAPADQADMLWRSAQCFTKAQQPDVARSVLQELLKLPATPERQAEIWFALGQAHKALGHADQSRQAFYKSLEFPASPVILKTRLELAEAEINQKNYQQAEDILNQIISASGASRDQEAREKSYYHLGSLLYLKGEYLKAAILLKEAVRQYPANPGALAARAHLGECYRKLAEEANQKLKSPESYADVKAHLVRSRQEWLEQALEVYQKLADHLERPANQTLNPAESKLRTEAVFAIADCRLDLGEHAEALRLFKALIQRYAHQVESLHAFRKMFQCYYAMSGPEKTAALADVRAAAQTALDDLPNLPAEAFDPHRFGTREAWRTWLNEVQRYLERQAPTAGSNKGV